MSKKKKNELTYFLDHPQIKRNPSPGNGNSPSTNEPKGFFNRLAAGKLAHPGGGSQAARPKSSATSAPRQAAKSNSNEPKGFFNRLAAGKLSNPSGGNK